MPHGHDSHFLNLDVEIISKEDLSPLVEFFGNRVFALCNEFSESGLYRVVLETNSTRLKGTPERYLKFFLELFESIPDHLQGIWKNRRSLAFDIGVQAGILPPPYPVEVGRKIDVFFEPISASTLSRVAKLKGSLAFTVYPYDPAPNPPVEQAR